jgi:predicted DNA-binding protein YlxM (UPF0122 family)
MKTIHKNMPQKSLGDKQKNREQIDLLSSRIDLLKGKDRLLMTMYLENGYSFFEIAKVTGMNQASISRRIKRLKKKLLEGRYLSCLRNSDKLNRYQMLLAKDYFLRGLSMKEIAIKRHCSFYQVREKIQKIKSILNQCEYAKTK